jgi:hypothetical protein
MGLRFVGDLDTLSINNFSEFSSALKRQLTYLVVSMRQKLLAIPAKLYSRLGPERFPREVAQECERYIHEVLDELAKLPECAEPDWLERLEEEKEI